MGKLKKGTKEKKSSSPKSSSCKSKIIKQIFNYIANENEEDKNQRKWQKIMDKAFVSKIDYEENNIEEKTEEKFKNDQEIKNIINELYIKQKNSQYLFNKQRQVLKKFNIQEKIQREETKIINDNEESKNNDIFNDAIQKLAACHMLGFEPLTVIRQKILTKIQSKYNINEENMNQLSSYFESNSENDKELENKRREKQIEVLDNLLSDSKKFNYKEIDKATIIKVKNEIKKYEKDLELKASQNEDENKLNALNQFLSKDMEDNNMNQIQEEENLYNENEDDDDFKIKITDYISNGANETNKEQLSIEDFQKNIINDLQKEMDNKNEINENKIEIEEQKEKEKEKECIIDDYNEFNSVILNNFAWKMKYQKKLSDFDNQILLYVTHSIIDELNCAKKNKRDFNFIVSPQEMIKFLKEFQVEKIKDNFVSPNDVVKKSVSPSPITNNI